MTSDAGNPKNVQNAKDRAYHLDEREANGILKICNDHDCRFVLATFLEQANLFHSAFNPNPTEHAYNEGFRNAGLWWMNKALLHDPQIMGKIQADKARNRKAEEEHDRRNSDTSSSTSE